MSAFGGKSGHRPVHCTRPLLTQSGHKSLIDVSRPKNVYHPLVSVAALKGLEERGLMLASSVAVVASSLSRAAIRRRS